MRIVLTGPAGQVGHALLNRTAPPGVEWSAAGREVMDLANPAAVADALVRLRPDAVINCAAYTAVDRAESEAEAADAVNHLGPAAIAAYCGRHGLPLIHLSTDYVFDGTKAAPYAPGDTPAPLGVYGRTKEAGERAVRAACPRHIILRTAWVYGAHRHNFVRTMLHLGATRDTLRVVADQHGNPTSAEDLAAALGDLAGRLAAGQDLPAGTWHFAGRGDATWHAFANAIFDLAAPRWGRRPVVEPIPTADYPTPAPRPANSRLDSTAAERDLGLVARPWRDALPPVVAALLDQAGDMSLPRQPPTAP